MSYRVFTADGDQWVRLIRIGNGTARVMKPFDGAWTCDPCASYRERYTVRHPGGERSHAWHEVITNDDDARTRYIKLMTARNVAKLATLSAYAERMYREYARGDRTDYGVADALAIVDASAQYLRTH